MIKSNPFSGKVPKPKKRKPHYLKEDEIKKMRDYFFDYQIEIYQEKGKLQKLPLPRWQYDLVFLTLNTGLRKSEAFDLSWDHIDLINEQMIFPGKGDKERVVPLNYHAMAILRKRPRHINNKRVFPEITNADSINNAWKKFRQRTGIKSRFHDLRVTYASYFMMNGGNILELKEILGHEDLKTVLIYATLSREALHKHKNVVGF